MMDDEAKSAKEHPGARTTPVVTTVKRVGKYEVGKTIGEGEFSKLRRVAPLLLLTDDAQGEAGDQHRNRRASGAQDFVAAADR